MRIKTITVRNFQCFGSTDTVIELNDLTGFIGANGTGKTAVLQALCRMFGTSQTLRKLQPTDFHVPIGEKLDSRDDRQLTIEVRIEFPELEEGKQLTGAVPPSFNHMIVSEPGEAPYCRIRLEGKWTRTPIVSGDVEERLCWITTPEPEPELDGDRDRVSPHDRARIQVFYVPASRDTAKQLGNVSGTLLHQLLSSVRWKPELRESVRKAAEGLRDQFKGIPAIDLINEANKNNWNELYTEEIYSTPSLRFAGVDFDDVLKEAQIMFGPTIDNAEHDCDRLSEGQQSLFYFAFIATLFTIRQKVHSESMKRQRDQHKLPTITDHISFERLRPAPLTVFAVEEPENHLSPHYLGRLMRQLDKIAKNDCGQVILCSHSSAIVSRVDPENLRYFRMDHELRTAAVRPITLPLDESEAEKYVREAVKAFPELYFSSLVILCEGDSEQLALPQLASAYGYQLDSSFVSVVPLGGRYVNHLWRLLNDLDIPYVTLLDLDRGRKTGGWGTIKYALTELLKIHTSKRSREQLLTVKTKSGHRTLDDKDVEEMHKRGSEALGSIDYWCKRLRDYRVFFSLPLDFDFMMLSSYPNAYQSTQYEGRGPKELKKGAFTEARIEEAVEVVLGQGGDGSSYSSQELRLFPWYSYLFLGRSKPSTHMLALLRIPDAEKLQFMPEPIQALMHRIQAYLTRLAKREDERVLES